jgi:hypothetical protein
MPKTSEISWIKYHITHLEFTRKTKPPFEQWENEIIGSETRRKSDPWWRGDLYNQGSVWYGENMASSIFDPEDWGEQSLKTFQNNASVCARIEASRRREKLSYSHHAEVAYLEPKEQDRFLQLAIDEKLSIRKLREQIQEDQKKKGKEVKFNVGPIDTRLNKLADKAEALLEELAGDSHALVLTGIESFRDAAEIERDNQKIEAAAWV